MGLETGTYIDSLVATNPVGSTDTVSTLDGHIQLLKSTIKATFPNVTGAVTPTHTVLNYVDATSSIQTQLNLKAALASPALTGTPTAPTAAAGTSTTQIATTAFVQTAVGALDTIVAVAALDIDCSAGRYFTKTIAGDSTFTVSSVPSGSAYSFTLELTHTSGTVTWFSGVEWPGAVSPTLTTGKTHLFMFVTDDGGTRWRGSYLANYTN